MSSSRVARTEILRSRDLEVLSNFSDFFRLFHFHGLNSLPIAEKRFFLFTGDAEAE